MRILLGYDGSKFADAALSDLHRAGLPNDVEVIVLCAVDMIAAPASTNGKIDDQPLMPETAEAWHARVQSAVAEARAIAERGANLLRAKIPSWKISAEAVADSPGWAILKRAEGFGEQPWRADLIVVGAAGHSAISRVIFGSVAHKVLTNARCSTRIARARQAPDDKPVRLLIGVDGSHDSRAAIAAVARRIWPAGTECRVMTVEDFRMRTSIALSMPPLPPELHAQRLAQEAAATLRVAGLKSTAVAEEGEAAHCLVNEAADYGADCIFVGARGLGRMERFLLGSVSAAVAMRAPCSVEIVHSEPRR
jgi:nucleotide-binding universal stress UspA family protein